MRPQTRPAHNARTAHREPAQHALPGRSEIVVSLAELRVVSLAEP